MDHRVGHLKSDQYAPKARAHMSYVCVVAHRETVRSSILEIKKNKKCRNADPAVFLTNQAEELLIILKSK
jgi:hypothetical protein